MNTPVINSDIIETRNGISVLLQFSRAAGEPLSALLRLPGIPQRGERHYVVFLSETWWWRMSIRGGMR
ncbi:MAG: hypothetical protein Q7S52_04285 [bacterium]|nr:hypothetical protein [bacterium]